MRDPRGPRGSLDAPLDALDDTRLVAAAGDGDGDALKALYARHGGAIFALARRLLDEQAAEEIVQEVFLRLWNQPERFDPTRGALRSFLFKQTHSRAVERIRSESARRRREERHDRELAPRAGDIEQEAWELIRTELVKDAVRALSEGERDAINLAYFGGHTYREVAQLLDLPEGTVKSRIRQGLMKLAATFEASGIGARQ